ncbi:hypothetical protein BH23ACT2_BH23ACT2_02270 [soil metagenome]
MASADRLPETSKDDDGDGDASENGPRAGSGPEARSGNAPASENADANESNPGNGPENDPGQDNGSKVGGAEGDRSPAPAANGPESDTGGKPTPPERVPGGASTKVIVRIDHTALIRGHAVAGETVEVAGLGPVPVAAVKDLMGDTFLAAVITRGHDVINVAHLGRRVNAHQRTALETTHIACTRNGLRPAPLTRSTPDRHPERTTAGAAHGRHPVGTWSASRLALLAVDTRSGPSSTRYATRWAGTMAQILIGSRWQPGHRSKLGVRRISLPAAASRSTGQGPDAGWAATWPAISSAVRAGASSGIQCETPSRTSNRYGPVT